MTPIPKMTDDSDCSTEEQQKEIDAFRYVNLILQIFEFE